MFSNFKYLNDYTTPLLKPNRDVVGREKEIKSVLANLYRPEVSNVILLGEAGSGKTMLIQGVSAIDEDRIYLEINLSKMLSNNGHIEMPNRLKSLFEEAVQFKKTTSKELVFFIDEFHQIIQQSSSAVETIKPILANSGVLGIKIIAATTFDEFQEYVSPNQALVERLQRLNIREPNKEVVIDIMKSVLKNYGFLDLVTDDTIYDDIYYYTNKYIPSSSQPRKSILVLDSMIGWCRSSKNIKFDKKLLGNVLHDNVGINIFFNIEPSIIRKTLNRRVLSQKLATRIVEEKLQIAVAGLHDNSRPMSSFLFAGSTGVGKALDDNTSIPVFFENRVIYKRNGDLAVGDLVLDEFGSKNKVLGVYPQGYRDTYVVYLEDGRSVLTSNDHLWNVKLDNSSSTVNISTKEIMSFINDGSYVYLPLYKPKEIDNDLLDSILELLREKEVCNLSSEGFMFEVDLAIDDVSLIRNRLFKLGLSNNLFYIENKLFFLVANNNFLSNKIFNMFFNDDFCDFKLDPFTRITAVKKLSVKRKMTCIYVENNTHLYMCTKNYIVTHNTELAKGISDLVFGSERYMIRFDMSEFANENSIDRFRHELTSRVWASPFSLLLIDEVEKANKSVLRLLLQVLDDGRLSDKNGREVSFHNCYIIMTTNAGSEFFKDASKYAVSDTGDGENLKDRLKIFRDSLTDDNNSASSNKFPPELIGRIDALVPFQPLSEETIKHIILKKMKSFKDIVYEKYRINIEYDQRVLYYFSYEISDTDSNRGGARKIMVDFNDALVTKVSKVINHSKGNIKNIAINVKGELVYENKNKIKSDAVIEVGIS